VTETDGSETVQGIDDDFGYEEENQEVSTHERDESEQ